MMMHETSDDKARARLHAQVTGAGEVSAEAGKHPGHWHLHHMALAPGPGDWTPYPAPEYAEEEMSPLGELLEHLTELLGADHARAIAERGLEAGQ